MNENTDIIEIVKNCPKGQNLIDKIFSNYKSFKEFLFFRDKTQMGKR